MTIHWLALGISRTATGIERMVARHAADLLAARQASTDDVILTLHADVGAEWTAELDPDPRLRVIRHPRRSGRLAIPPRRDHLRGATLVHSFSGVLPSLHGALRCYTVHDWGPFRDPRIGAKARVLWCYAMIRSIAAADHVYFYSPLVASSAPLPVARLLRAKRVHVVSPPGYHPTTARPCLSEPSEAYLLFVGTAVPRKRLDRLVEAVESSGFRLVLAGDGTERFGGARVRGMGRVDEPTLEALYAGALAVVLISEYEGFGLPVLEAVAHGRRAIVSPEVAAVHRSERPDVLIEVDCSSADALADALNTWVPGELAAERPVVGVGQTYLPLELTYVAF